MKASDKWGSDVPISMPEVVDNDLPVITQLGAGFGFTTRGLVHNISSRDREEMFSPFFAPEGEVPGQ